VGTIALTKEMLVTDFFLKTENDRQVWSMIPGFVKFLLEKVLSLPPVANTVARDHIQNVMSTPVTPLNLGDVPFVQNIPCYQNIRGAFNHKYGGAHVFIAPPGSGKTTYIRKYCNEFIADGGFVILFGSELHSRKIFDQSFGDIRDNLFDLLPSRSVIVLDQLEHHKLSDDMKSLIRHLALESRRTAQCNVILSLSDIQVAQEILGLNGNDKIQQWGRSSEFEWTYKEVKEFIDEGCKGWSKEDQNALFELGCKAKCPAFLHGVFATCSDGLPKDRKLLEQRVKKFEDSWEAFRSSDL
jgi:hypothetical protein